MGDVQQVSSPYAQQEPQPPTPSPLSRLGSLRKFAFIIVLFLVGIAILAVGYILGTKKSETISKNQQTPSSTITRSSSKFTFVRDGDIWVSNGQNNKLTDYKHNFFPILSRDFSKIAYLSLPIEEVKSAGEGIDGLGPSKNIWIINFDGSGPKKLTKEPDHYSDVKFSSDGKYLSFIRTALFEPIGPFELIVIDLFSNETTIKQTIDSRFEYTWGPNNDELAVAVRTRGLDPGELIGINVFKIDLNSKQLQKIGTILPFANDYLGMDYSISPDLRHIAYFGGKQNVISYGKSNFDWGYWLANLDGTNLKEILGKKTVSKSHGPNINFRWSPDSKFVAFFNEEDSSKPTTLHVYEVSTDKIYDAIESESSLLVWDQYGNLYLRRFITNVGTEDVIKRVDFRTGKVENFLENADDLNFGY